MEQARAVSCSGSPEAAYADGTFLVWKVQLTVIQAAGKPGGGHGPLFGKRTKVRVTMRRRNL